MDPFLRLLLGWTVWRLHDSGEPSGGPAPAPATAPQPPPAAPTPAPAAPASPSPAPAPPASSGAAPAAPNGSPTPAGPPSFDQWLQDPINAGFVKQLRDEAAGHRTKAKSAEDKAAGILKAVMDAAGLQQDGTPDPAQVAEQLKAQVTQRDAELKQLRIDNALATATGKHSANPGLTRALLLTDGSLQNLDPAAADFPLALEAAVIRALSQYPMLATAQAATPAPPPSAAPGAPPAPPVSGGQFPGPGAGNGPAQLTKEQLKGMTPEEIVAAQKDGKLDALLGRI